MNAGPAGFRGAPITKALVLATIASSVISQAASRRIRRTAPHMAETFSHVFTFKNPGELLFGALLIYYFRLLERQMGTSKYGSYAFITFVLSRIFQSVLSNLFHRPSACGAYSLIFSNIIAFFLEVPALQKFKFFGINVTDKVFIYLAATQLLFSSGQRSVAAGLCGALAGALYHFDFLRLTRFRLPGFVEQLISSTIGSIVGGPTPPRRITVASNIGATAAAEEIRSSRNAPATLPEPSIEAVQQLVDMGFDDSRARRALQLSGNNIELALQSLL